MNKFYPIFNESEGVPTSAVNKIKLGDLDQVTAPDGSIVNLKRIKDQINKIRTLIVAQDPLYAPFVYELGLVYTWAVKTMATDGNWLFINPKFTEGLDFDECTFVIYHELMHCLLDHMKRGKMGNYSHKKFNYAADYEINAMFIDMQEDYDAATLFGGALKGVLYNTKFLNQPAEAIYDQIPEPPPDEPGDNMPGQPGEKGEGQPQDGEGDSQEGDEGDGGDGKNSKFEAGKLGKADSTDARLQREVANEAGNIPGGMISPELGKKIAEQAGLDAEDIAEGNKTADDWTKKSKELLDRAVRQNKSSGGGAGNMLTKILGNHHNSVINWKSLLNRFVGDILSKKDLSWRMPNRRYSAGDPNAIRIRAHKTGKQLSKIIVCMDTSGSMERKLIQGIIDEINAILKTKKVKEIVVLFFDDGIKTPQVISGNQKAFCPEVIGGGGTNFQVPLDYIKSKYKDQVSLCLFFTDGYENIPKKPVYADKFIWIVYDNPTWPSSNHVGSNPPFGKKILVNTKSLQSSIKFISETVKFYGELVTESIKHYIK
jgi:predicted metal-dependent peptidase